MIPDQFVYFMIRLRLPVGATRDELDGVIERIGTGEKRRFRGREQLLRLVDRWPELDTNMQADPGGSQ